MMDRKEAIEILQRISDDKTEELHICDDEGGSVCGLILEEQNAILAGIEALKERPHGEWEHWGSPFTDDCIANSIVCSLCKARYVEIEGEVFNFCPNCGADMRQEEGEEE